MNGLVPRLKEYSQIDEKKQDFYTCCLRETQYRWKDTQSESKGIKVVLNEKGNKQKNAGVAILISDKIDFITKAITREKEVPNNSTCGHLSKENENSN